MLNCWFGEISFNYKFRKFIEFVGIWVEVLLLFYFMVKYLSLSVLLGKNYSVLESSSMEVIIRNLSFF